MHISSSIPVCHSTRSLKFRPFRGSSERRCSLTKLPRPTVHRHGLASAARIDSRVGDRSVHRTEVLPMDRFRSDRRQTGKVVC